VTNEGELEVVLKKHGFQTIVNSKLSLLEKIRLFANAEVVVSTSGAGLAGLFFCQNGSSLIELFPEGFLHTHYYNNAVQNGMRYFSLICTNDNPSKNMKQGQLEDLYVDLSEIEKLLLQVEDNKQPVEVLEK
jgi:capsular polysaccharide biosynthesis protein